MRTFLTIGGFSLDTTEIRSRADLLIALYRDDAACMALQDAKNYLETGQLALAAMMGRVAALISDIEWVAKSEAASLAVIA